MDLASLTSSTSEAERRGHPHLWPFILLTLFAMVLAVVFLGPRDGADIRVVVSPSSTPERETRIYTVSYRFGVFSPTNLRIHAGDTVRFRNDSAAPVRVIAQRQSSAQLPEFDSIGPVESGGYFSYTFSTIGTFGYYNFANKNEVGVIMVRS